MTAYRPWFFTLGLTASGPNSAPASLARQFFPDLKLSIPPHANIVAYSVYVPPTSPAVAVRQGLGVSTGSLIALDPNHAIISPGYSLGTPLGVTGPFELMLQLASTGGATTVYGTIWTDGGSE